MRNHKSIRSMAVSMQTKAERIMKGKAGSPFYSKAWSDRKKAIEDRVTKKIARVKIRKAERIQALKDNKPVVYSIK